MRAQLLEAPGTPESTPLRSRELDTPNPAPDELQIRVTACAVCRTDLQLIAGDLEPHRLPIIPGHQAVGRVTRIGDAVSGWLIGDRVGVGWLGGACGRCRYCTAGKENLCGDASFTGWDRDGGFAEEMTVRADYAFPLPAAFEDTAAAPLLCGGVIGYRALKISEIEPGGRLGLYGFGASALLAIQVALHWGCEVFVTTRSTEEQQRALRMGAVWAGSYHDTPPVPLDAAVTFAPVGYVIIEALRAVDRGGTVAINAIHLDRIPEFPYRFLWSERRLQSVANFTREDAHEFLALAAELPITTVIDPYPLEAAGLVMTRLLKGQVKGAAVLTM